jgi:signal peptidase II
LFDRLRLGFVTDYLDLHVWPVFNLADAAIVAGAGVLVLALWREGRAATPRR